MKIAHECPNCIFDMVQALTDYDYCLVHLLDQNTAYLKNFVEAKNRKREIILDNSIFELGKAYDAKRYAYWVNELNPTYYIVPDVLDDVEGTIANYSNWMYDYGNALSYVGRKHIAVVQGKTYEDFVKCYEYYRRKHVDKIAFSFDSYLYKTMFKEIPVSYDLKLASGRYEILTRMIKDNIIDPTVPVHLLGISLPQELYEYSDQEYSFIDSVDTSNPVVFGINNIRYDFLGPNFKIKTKVIDYMDNHLSIDRKVDIAHNIVEFRNIVKHGA